MGVVGPDDSGLLGRRGHLGWPLWGQGATKQNAWPKRVWMALRRRGGKIHKKMSEFARKSKFKKFKIRINGNPILNLKGKKRGNNVEIMRSF